MTLSHLTDNIFVGIDVGGAGLDVAWHRGDSAHYANRPDAMPRWSSGCGLDLK